ncbi:MAG: hypothetical protein DI589_05790 [Shinella sp.]|nr:MAG: hypothetical protein DI589_05790 [Shinella sp.]
MNERNFSTGDAFSASHGLHPCFAMAKDIVAECRQGSTGDVDYELDKLILRFTEAAQTIDPRIEAVWVGRDGDQFKTPFMIHMVRRGA